MYFKTTKPKSYRQELDVFDDIPKCVWDIKNDIIQKENLYNYEQEPTLKDSVGYMINGGDLHLHTDPNPCDKYYNYDINNFTNKIINENDLVHVRFNVYVQIPHSGGLPIYRNILCSLKERTYICCLSGIDAHYTNKVVGDRERIVISFGFLIPKNHIPNIQYKY